MFSVCGSVYQLHVWSLWRPERAFTRSWTGVRLFAAGSLGRAVTSLIPNVWKLWFFLKLYEYFSKQVYSYKCACLVVLEAKEGIAFPRTGVTDGGATMWMLGIEPGSGQSVLLTIKPLLHYSQRFAGGRFVCLFLSFWVWDSHL